MYPGCVDLANLIKHERSERRKPPRPHHQAGRGRVGPARSDLLENPIVSGTISRVFGVRPRGGDRERDGRAEPAVGRDLERLTRVRSLGQHLEASRTASIASTTAWATSSRRSTSSTRSSRRSAPRSARTDGQPRPERLTVHDVSAVNAAIAASRAARPRLAAVVVKPLAARDLAEATRHAARTPCSSATRSTAAASRSSATAPSACQRATLAAASRVVEQVG